MKIAVAGTGYVGLSMAMSPSLLVSASLLMSTIWEPEGAFLCWNWFMRL